MKRKVILSKEAILWDAGDNAKTFAILESGKLGVKTEKGLAGVVWPKMVLGESAILTSEGERSKRTATVFALEEGSVVVEYPAYLAKQSFEESGNLLGRAILMTLIGQISRNCLLLLTAHKHNPFVAQPFKVLMQAIVQTYKPHVQSVQSWDDFLFAFHYLAATRDYTEAMQQKLMVASADKDAIFKASEITHEFFKGHDDVPFLKDFLSAEQERRDWIQRYQS